MRVLGVIGSHTKGGNTEVLVREALNAAKNEGAEIEMIPLRDKQIADCDGCRTCIKTGKCRIQDDMQEIYESLLRADGIIVGSPCYFMSVTGICQCFINRTFSLFANPIPQVGKPKLSRLKGKVGGAVAVGQRRGITRTLFTLHAFLSFHSILEPHPGAMAMARDWRVGGIREQDEVGMELSRELGKEIVKFLRKLEK
ncbi:flavodoxin family protein [Chloroflexota bacterium]